MTLLDVPTKIDFETIKKWLENGKSFIRIASANDSDTIVNGARSIMDRITYYDSRITQEEFTILQKIETDIIQEYKRRETLGVWS